MSKTVWIYQESNRPGLDHVSIHKSKEAALAAALVSVVLWEEHAGAPQETVSSNFHKWEWRSRFGHPHTVRVMQTLVRVGGAGDGEK